MHVFTMHVLHDLLHDRGTAVVAVFDVVVQRRVVKDREERIARRAEQRAIFQDLGGYRRLSEPVAVSHSAAAGCLT